MSTSLKVQYANEIAEAMAKTLGDKEFTGLYRTAAFKAEGGPALEAYKRDLASAKTKEEVDASRSKHEGAVKKDEKDGGEGSLDGLLKLQSDKAKSLGLPGYETPMADDAQAASDQHANDCACQDCGDTGMNAQDAGDKCPGCGKACSASSPCGCGKCDCKPESDASDAQVPTALNFAMEHLAKLSDVLDKRGFSGISNIVDETIEKLAAKKK